MKNLLDYVKEFIGTENTVYFFGNSVWHWALFVVITIVAYFTVRFVFNGIIKFITRVTKLSSSKLAPIIIDTTKRSKFWFFAAIAFFFGTCILNLGKYNFIPIKILAFASFIQIGIWLNIIFDDLLINWSKKNENPSQRAAVVIIQVIGRFLIWVVILLLILDNFGVKVISLLTGLGVGGIAVALAVQKILGDLFASVSIMIDKPFEIGDLITVGAIIGCVESIGVKTTKIRSITGEQIIIANSDLLDSRISNFKRMKERRITFSVNVSNQTSKESIQAIVDIIKDIIENQDNARFDRGHLKGFSPGSINYEFIYWITKPEYITYMDVQQNINLAVINAFAERKINMSYPAQTVLLQKQIPPETL